MTLDQQSVEGQIDIYDGVGILLSFVSAAKDEIKRRARVCMYMESRYKLVHMHICMLPSRRRQI